MTDKDSDSNFEVVENDRHASSPQTIEGTDASEMHTCLTCRACSTVATALQEEKGTASLPFLVISITTLVILIAAATLLFLSFPACRPQQCHPISEETQENTWLLHRLNKNHTSYKMYKSKTPTFERNEKYPIGLLPSTPSSSVRRTIPAKHMPAHVHIEFEYTHIHATPACTETFNNLFIHPFEEGCDVSWSRFMSREPLYVWQGGNPCTPRCKEIMDAGYAAVQRECTAEDVNFPPEFLSSTGIPLDDFARRAFKVRYEQSCEWIGLEEKSLDKKERPRNLPDFFTETRRYFRGSSPRLECTEDTKMWLRDLFYQWESEEKNGRKETYMRALSHAVNACGDPELRTWFDKAARPWLSGRHRSGDLAEILLRGLLPDDEPLDEFNRILEDSTANLGGIKTYETLLLTSHKRCYPFIDSEVLRNVFLVDNVLMQVAMCDINCPDEARELEAAIDADTKSAEDYPKTSRWSSELLDGGPMEPRIYKALWQMHSAIYYDWRWDCLERLGHPRVPRHIAIPPPCLSRLRNVPKSPALHEYNGLTLSRILELLHADPQMALLVYWEPAQDPEWNGKPEYAEAAKKQIVCHPTIRRSIDFAWRLDPLDATQYWWQRFKYSHPSWEIYRQLVIDMFDIVNEYNRYCGKGAVPYVTNITTREELETLLLMELVSPPRPRGSRFGKERVGNWSFRISDKAENPDMFKHGALGIPNIRRNYYSYHLPECLG